MDTIATLTTERDIQLNRMKSLQEVANAREDSTFSDEEQTIFDTCDTQIERLDKQIENQKRLERREAATAKPLDAATVPADSGSDDDKSLTRAAGSLQVGMAKRTPGALFVELAAAYHIGRGNVEHAASWAEHEYHDADLARIIRMPQHLWRATVNPGDTATAGYAAELTTIRQQADEFIELLRPNSVAMNLVGRMLDFGSDSSLTVPGQSAGVSGGWIAEGGPIAVEKITTIEKTLTPKEIAVIAVVTNKLIRRSNPQVLELLRDDMIKGTGTTVDVRFLSATAGGNAPSGILNGLTPTSAPTYVAGWTGAERARADAMALRQKLNGANAPMGGRKWVFNTQQLDHLYGCIDGLGNAVYEDELNRGVFMQYPFEVSNNQTPSVVTLVATPTIAFARGVGPQVDLSTDATIETSDAPGGDIAAAADGAVSMYQSAQTATRLIWEMDWIRRHDAAVTFMAAVNWDPTSVTP